MRRSGFSCIGAMALCAVLAAPAGAKRAQTSQLKISVPKEASGNRPITVSWRTDRALSRGQAYSVVLQTGGGPERDGPACSWTSLTRVVGRGTGRGRRITVRFPVPKEGRWCPTRVAGALVSLKDSSATLLGSAGFTILDHRGLIPSQMSWGRWTFGPLSTMTVKVAGRPDRTAPITATIDQDTLGPPLLGDTLWTNASGTVTPGALPADPLCTAAPIAPIAVDRSTTLVFPGVRSPQTPPPELSLVLRGNGTALTGCAPDGPQPAVTAVVLTGAGAANPAPGRGIQLTGTLDGLRLAGGAVASVAFDVALLGGSPPL